MNIKTALSSIANQIMLERSPQYDLSAFTVVSHDGIPLVVLPIYEKRWTNEKACWKATQDDFWQDT
jgi:hypothetical protein